jgi:putative endonuclease
MHLRNCLSRFPISRENPHGPIRASAITMHGIEKRIVYIIRSDADPSRHYVGITNDLRARLEWHNFGPCGHTQFHRPWSVVVSLEFPTEKEAVRFEKYLKSGSGRAFATRHFGPA